MSERAISSDLQLNVSPSEESAGAKSRGYQLDRRGELEAMAADKRDVVLLFDVDYR